MRFVARANGVIANALEKTAMSFGALEWFWGLLLIPVLIAFSRMVLGAHYLSDVIFAAILGVVCALLIRRWLSIEKSGPVIPSKPGG